MICILISLTKVLHNHKFAQSYLLLETIFHSNNVAHVPLNLCFSDMYRLICIVPPISKKSFTHKNGCKEFQILTYAWFQRQVS